MATKRPSTDSGIDAVKRRLQFSNNSTPTTTDEGGQQQQQLQSHHLCHHDQSMDDDRQGGSMMGASAMVGYASSTPGFDSLDRGMESTPHQDCMIREQDRFLPIANVARIMKRVLPESGKVAKEAKECVQECVSEFISFITSEASERCMHEKRKTINGEDIIWAMHTLGFDPYVEPLKVYLSKYRISVKGDKNPAANNNNAANTFTMVTINESEPGTSDGGGANAMASTDGDDLQPGTTLYLSPDDLINVTGEPQRHRQLQVATNADGQLTLIEMRTDADGNVIDSNDGSSATTIAIPVSSGENNGGGAPQQYILTTLDQSGLGGGGQQFTIPAGAQLAFIPSGGGGGASGSNGAITTAHGIPVMFLDSSSTSSAMGGNQMPQYITMNASGQGGLQIIQMAPSTMVAGGMDEHVATGSGDQRSMMDDTAQ